MTGATQMAVAILAALMASSEAWTLTTTQTSTSSSLLAPQHKANARRVSRLEATPTQSGNLHGQNACFLPLSQLAEDYFAPRILQIAGAYPGLTRDDFFAVTSEPAPDQGQWAYDFSDPDGPQLGTVAIEGSQIIMDCEDPVVVIAEHFSIGVQLPAVITEPVDLVVVVDRAKNTFKERKFLIVDTPGEDGLRIESYNEKRDMPSGAEILGQVEIVQIPWLPSMERKKTGFLEADEYY